MVRINGPWYGLSDEEARALEKILDKTVEELIYGDEKYGPHPGPQRALGAIKAEVQELDTEVSAENEIPLAEIREAIQVAAMGIKYVRDICSHDIPLLPNRSPKTLK